VDERLLLKLEEARATALALMDQHGLVAAGWVFAWNRRRCGMGLCVFPRNGRPGRIELSYHFVLRNPEAEIRDCVLHEISHALVGPGHGHDRTWKLKCIEIGARPERCGQADMPAGRWRAVCPRCGASFNRHRRPKRVTGWHCRGCGPARGPLTWASG
jgi:predicted SprT family Zn-dependent metalloprotease